MNTGPSQDRRRRLERSRGTRQGSGDQIGFKLRGPSLLRGPGYQATRKRGLGGRRAGQMHTPADSNRGITNLGKNVGYA